MTLREALRQAEARIASGDIPDARLEAELLLMHCLSLDRAGLYARLGEEQIYAETRAPQVLAVAARRADGALTLILVNRSPHDVSAPLVLAGHPATAAAATWRLDRQHNSTQIADTPLDAPLLLPAESVTLLIIP